MRKDLTRGAIVLAVILIVYNLVAFIVPFVKTSVFWIAYGFAMLSIVIAAVALYRAFYKNTDTKSRFYGFPCARIGVLYSAAQFILSIILMALSVIIPWWIALIICVIAFGVAVIGLVFVEIIVDEIKEQETAVKKNTAVMQELRMEINAIANLTDESETDKILKKLAEEFRFSDPVSNEQTAQAEQALRSSLNELRQAVVNNEKSETVAKLCKNISVALAERNRLCKISK